MRVLLVRANRNDADAKALHALRIEPTIDPLIEVASTKNAESIRRLKAALNQNVDRWLIATSVNAIEFLKEAIGEEHLLRQIREAKSLRFAAVGDQTASALKNLGATEVLTGEFADSKALAERFQSIEPTSAIVPKGNLASNFLENSLRDLGFVVTSETIYTTHPRAAETETIDAINAGEINLALLRSPSAAVSLASQINPAQLPVFTAGNSTTLKASELGFTIAGSTRQTDPTVVAAKIAELQEGNTL